MSGKLLSGRFLATVMLTFTYCLIMIMVVWTGNKLMLQKDILGKEVITFVIGNFTGTAIGAVIAYFFRTDRQQPTNGGITK